MRGVYSNILECVGDTPIVKLNRLGADLQHSFYVKLEFMNPGHSVKDRIAIQMVEDAERAGKLPKGGTIIECTSGNTGMGLAMVAAVKGYQSVFVMPDKVSEEKVKALRAFGARVITTPTAVAPEDPRSYYSVAKRLREEIPNSFLADQYNNPSNPEAHYRTTGPEIWEQMGEKLDFLVVAAGTGGTISGTAKFLKEKNPKLRTLAIDPEGSIFYDYFRTKQIPKMLKTYKVEGFGEDFLPEAIDFSLVDDIVQVNDQECFLTGRELVKREGIFAGGSGGGAVAGALKFARTVEGTKSFLILLPDSGSRYLSKMFDDAWMRENRFLGEGAAVGTVRDMMEGRAGGVMTAGPRDRVGDVIAVMKKHSISQLPVIDEGALRGLITEIDLLGALLEKAATTSDPVEKYLSQNFKTVGPDVGVDHLGEIFRNGQIAIVVEAGKVVGIITKIDLVAFLSGRDR